MSVEPALSLPLPDPETTRITAPGELMAFGLRINSLDQVMGSLIFEAPVSVSFRWRGSCEIGAFTYQGGGGEIYNTRIGRYCSIGAHFLVGRPGHPSDWAVMHPFTFGGTNHFRDFPEYAQLTGNKQIQEFQAPSWQGIDVQIGHDVWIGEAVTILKSVDIQGGAIVAMNSIVNKDIAGYHIYGGTPARRISRRFGDLDDARFAKKCKALARSRWWDIAPEQMPVSQVVRDPELFADACEPLDKNFKPRRFRIWRDGTDVFVGPA